MKHADFLILIGGRCDRKWRFSNKETAFEGVQKILNGEIFMNFSGGRCDRKWRFSKKETAFAGVQKFLNGEIFMNFIGGRCDKKWRFSNEETAFAGVQKFLNGEIFMNFIKRNLLHMATFHEFDLIGERCEKNDDFKKRNNISRGTHVLSWERCS